MNFEKLISMDKSICGKYFSSVDSISEVLSNLSKWVLELGSSLDKEHYVEIDENIWIGKNVKIDPLSTIVAPCIIDDDTEVRPGAYLRGNVIIGKRCVIGNGTEIKNSIFL